MTSAKLAIGTALAILLGCSTKYDGGDTLGNGGGSLDPNLGALGDGGASGQYACDNHTINSTCDNYLAGTTETNAQAGCSGTLLTSACPVANAVGECTINGASTVYYSDGATPHTTAETQATCTSLGGAFTH
jgi:hypothetical protein